MAVDTSDWITDIEGNFPLHGAVLKVLPPGTRVVSAESSGISAWARTAKVKTISTMSGEEHQYFLKCCSGASAQAVTQGEFHSASRINEIVSGFVPRPVGWGSYIDDGTEVFFFIGEYRDMDLSEPPDADEFVEKLVEMHKRGTSPNGMFGYPIPTVIGTLQRTVTWEQTWAASFTNQLKDVLSYDTQANGPDPSLAAASDQLISAVIPRLLGALQSAGRSITPTLIHGDLWERNIGVSKTTTTTTTTSRRPVVVFDPGCTYAHNEMEFGTWRCSWATYLRSPAYLERYQREIPSSEPADEWDDRNRLYGVYLYLVDSAGHPGSASRRVACNDMLYLCERYAPLESLDRYDSEKDVRLSGVCIPVPLKQFERESGYKSSP